MRAFLMLNPEKEAPMENVGQNDIPLETIVADGPVKDQQEAANQLEALTGQYAQLFKEGARTPVLRRPSDYGMAYEDHFFPSADGVPLEAWFIPADSNKLLIVNHPMTCNRYGFPGHLEPWNQMFGGFEVNFLPELKALHEAGYNILTYDLRNCGMSGQANDNTSGLGLLECRDVVGSIRYAKSHPKLSTMKTGLYSRCMGGNSTIIAMSKWPDEFKHIEALVLLNVVSGKTFIERGAENQGLDPKKAADMLDEQLRQKTGFRLDDETPEPYAEAVKVPTLMAQLRRDFLIHGEKDGQAIFDALGSNEKELLWIEQSNQRFYAYNHFGQHPERLVGWFDQHMN